MAAAPRCVPQMEVPTSLTGVKEEDLTLLKQVGEGSYCTCHLVEYDGEDLAIKVLKPAAYQKIQAWRDLKAEAGMLSRLHHPNIIGFRGCGATWDLRPFMVLERLTVTLAESLAEVAQRDLVKRWPMQRALGCAAELAAALAYMHDGAFAGHALLHRDVKPDNIGFTADGRLVLFDFGLSKLLPSEQDGFRADQAPYKMTGGTGTERYMAPEVAQSKPYGTKADVYSFGMVLYYMCARVRPFDALGPVAREELRSAVADGQRPNVPSDWPSSLCSLTEACWHPRECERPSFAKILPSLRAIASEVQCAANDANPHTRPCSSGSRRPRSSPQPSRMSRLGRKLGSPQRRPSTRPASPKPTDGRATASSPSTPIPAHRSVSPSRRAFRSVSPRRAFRSPVRARPLLSNSLLPLRMQRRSRAGSDAGSNERSHLHGSNQHVAARAAPVIL